MTDVESPFLAKDLTPKDQITFAIAFQAAIKEIGKEQCWCLKEYNSLALQGFKTTKVNIFVYSIILLLISILPYFLNYTGLTYFIVSLFLGIYYVFLCFQLLIEDNDIKKISKNIFIYSILYLFLIFTFILIDSII